MKPFDFYENLKLSFFLIFCRFGALSLLNCTTCFFNHQIVMTLPFILYHFWFFCGSWLAIAGLSLDLMAISIVAFSSLDTKEISNFIPSGALFCSSLISCFMDSLKHSDQNLHQRMMVHIASHTSLTLRSRCGWLGIVRRVSWPFCYLRNIHTKS